MQPKRQMRRSRCGRRCRYRQPLPLSLPPPQALPLPLPLPSAPLLPRRPVNDVSGAINSIGSCFLHTWPTHYFFIPLFVSPFPPLSLSLSFIYFFLSVLLFFFEILFSFKFVSSRVLCYHFVSLISFRVWRRATPSFITKASILSSLLMFLDAISSGGLL